MVTRMRKLLLQNAEGIRMTWCKCSGLYIIGPNDTESIYNLLYEFDMYEPTVSNVLPSQHTCWHPVMHIRLIPSISIIEVYQERGLGVSYETHPQLVIHSDPL